MSTNAQLHRAASRTFRPSYPIPGEGSRDWKATIAMLRGMAADSELRANELDRPGDLRAAAAATASAYLFAVRVLHNVFVQYKGVKPRPTIYPKRHP